MKFVLSIVFILLAVAFFTLFERKILGYSHLRFGPNKMVVGGVFQPFSDALSLFLKLDYKNTGANFYFWFWAPVLGIFLSLILWSFMPFWGLLFFSKYSFLLLILVSGLGVYFLLYSGWSTSTKYSFLGSYRSSAQSVSYEVVFILLFFIIIYFWLYYGLVFSFYYSFLASLIYLSSYFMLCWVLSCLAECNRSPFDFSEGESELVSGFNTEYGGGLFSLIFIGEYSSILLFSLLTSILFFNWLLFAFFLFFSFIYLWVRTSFPRLRYDLLMMMAWKGLVIVLAGGYFMLFLFS